MTCNKLASQVASGRLLASRLPAVAPSGGDRERRARQCEASHFLLAN